MKKRVAVLLVLALVVLAIAPLAMADHCRKCNINNRCAIAVTGGKPSCDDSSGTCILQGLTCTGPHPLIEIEQPLAADFVVVSVERLDEPASPSDTAIAALETAAAPQR